MPARRQPCCGLCPKGERLIDESQDGPRSFSERFCTDTLCLVPFFLTVLLVAIIGQIAITTGDPTSIRFGTDHTGRRCGVGEFENLPKIYFPKLGTELVAQRELLATPWRLHLFGVCVRECPERDAQVYDVGGGSFSVALPTTSVLNRCLPVEEQDDEKDVVCVKPGCDEFALFGKGVTCAPVPGFAKAWAMDGDEQTALCERQLSLSVSRRYELPGSNALLRYLASVVGTMGRAAAAVSAARGEVLLCGVVLAALLGLGWLLFLRFCARFTVYLLLTLTLLVLLLATALCVVKGGLVDDAQLAQIQSHAETAMDQYRAQVGSGGAAGGAMALSDAQAGQVSEAMAAGLTAADAADATTFRYAAAALALCSAVYLVLLLSLRSTIGTVVAIVTEATVAVSANPALLPFPLTTLASLLAVYGYGGVVAAYLLTVAPSVADLRRVELSLADGVEGALNATLSATLGAIPAQLLPAEARAAWPAVPEVSEAVGVAELLPSDLDAQLLRNGMLLLLLFGVLWLAQTVQAVGYAAMSGAVSHWFFFRHTSEREAFPLLGALYRAVRFHLGSLALGALIVALVQTARVALEFVDQQSKRLQQGSKTAEVAIKCTKCCLWCLEKCLRYITGYAYIYVALNGDAFCAACHDTFKLLVNYPVQAAVNQLVQSLLFAVQSLLLPICCALAAYRLTETAALPIYLQQMHAAAADAAADANAAAAAASSRAASATADLLHDAQQASGLEAPAAGAGGGGGGGGGALGFLNVTGALSVASSSVVGALGSGVGWLTERRTDEPVDPTWPALAALLLAFVVARSFASVYECVVDTLFVCAMRDKDEYGGAHMGDSLRDALGLDDDGGGGKGGAAASEDTRHV